MIVNRKHDNGYFSQLKKIHLTYITKCPENNEYLNLISYLKRISD